MVDRYDNRSHRKASTPQPSLGVAEVMGGLAGVAAVGLSAVGLMCYRRVPPNKALVVYGRSLIGQNMKQTYTGGGAFVLPVLQASSQLSPRADIAQSSPVAPQLASGSAMMAGCYATLVPAGAPRKCPLAPAG